MSRISIIAAVGEGGVIGKNGKIPWHLSDDLKRFRELTTGHPVIMGRKTYESILAATGASLPKRTNIVLARRRGFCAPGCYIVSSWDEAVSEARCVRAVDGEIFVIGGAEIYKLALPHANRIYLTRVYSSLSVTGDAYFPDNELVWWSDVIPAEAHQKDEKNECAFSFHILERKQPARGPQLHSPERRTASKESVYLPNAHDSEQRAAMERIAERGHCPFCKENLAREHKQPILWESAHWIITPNQWPYKDTKEHLLLILKRHLERVEEMTMEEFGDLLACLQRLITERNLPGGGLCMRFGDPRFAGSTVRHLHAQLIVPDVEREGYAPILFRIGGKK